MKKNKLTQIWLDKAEEDLLYAKIALKETKIYGLLCFHCQQATEKLLKFYLTMAGIKFRKTHILPELLILCIKADENFNQFKESVLILDKYYIEPRYSESLEVYSKKEAQQAIRFVEEIKKFIFRKLK